MLDAAFGPTSAHHIVDSLVVGQAIQGGVDERVVLFVKLAEGRVLDDTLCKAVRTEVRSRRTARHVPDKVRFQLCTNFHARVCKRFFFAEPNVECALIDVIGIRSCK